MVLPRHRLSPSHFVSRLDQLRPFSVLQASASEPLAPSGKHHLHAQLLPLSPLEDHVGPPCPKSNLRPIRFASPFALANHQPHHAAHPSTDSPHPYSLEEFDTRSDRLPAQWVQLRRKLDAQDLQWTLLRARVEKLNQEFWATQSALFEASEAKVRQTKSSDSSSASENVSAIPSEEVSRALDDFYQRWLADQKECYMSYNLKWWRVQSDLIRGAWRAQLRVWKWRLACWTTPWIDSPWRKRAFKTLRLWVGRRIP